MLVLGFSLTPRSGENHSSLPGTLDLAHLTLLTVSHHSLLPGPPYASSSPAHHPQALGESGQLYDPAGHPLHGAAAVKSHPESQYVRL